ncbi:UNVERIFIED_CONTAM: hypothetical protein NCL1_22748 [Trichonephila clavipes]
MQKNSLLVVKERRLPKMHRSFHKSTKCELSSNSMIEKQKLKTSKQQKSLINLEEITNFVQSIPGFQECNEEDVET